MRALLALIVLFAAPAAQAAGCLKGAAVGGVAGHFVGHHGLAGAAVGCAVGHHEANKAPRTPAPTSQPSGAPAQQ